MNQETLAPTKQHLRYGNSRSFVNGALKTTLYT